MTIVTEWTEYLVATGASPATVRIRLRTLSALVNHAEVLDPLVLSRKDVLSFLARPIAAWTKLTYWKSIRAFSLWASEFDYAKLDLVKGIPKPKAPDAVARPIDDTTIKALLDARLPHRVRSYVLLALYEGLRVHEIAKIRGEDFDLTSRWLMVTGKGGITKPIPIHPEIVKLAQVMPEFGYWFPSSVDPAKHVRPEAVSQSVAGALRLVGSKATAHQLRDTAATRFQRQVKDIRLTQAMLRHKSIQSTMKYTENSNTALQAAMDGIDWSAAA